MKLSASAGMSDGWQLAEPLGGDWYLLAADDAEPHARRTGDAEPLLLDAVLRDKLRGGGALEAIDEAQQPWRVQRVAPGQLRVQSRAECCAALRRSWRGVLAAWLSDAVLHELRNPLNALMLQRDLLERALASLGSSPSQQAVDKLMPRMAVIRERLQELNLRQDAVVAMWLADDESAAEMPQPLARTLDQALRLVRSRCSQVEVRLDGELPALPPQCLLHDARGVLLAVMGALLLAADAKRIEQVRFDAMLAGDQLQLRLPLPSAYGVLADLLGVRTSTGLHACLAALLDAKARTLQITATQMLLSIPL